MLASEDSILNYGSLGNFSLAGFEMVTKCYQCQLHPKSHLKVLTRHASTYIITYFLPSGESSLLRCLAFLTKILKTFIFKIALKTLSFLFGYLLCSGLFVLVSWISFLIPMEEIGGRMGLLVILFLLLVNIFNTVATNTPKVGKYRGLLS